MPVNQSFRAHGKVLLSGEYLVLDGALALGLPTSLGQGLTIKESSGMDIMWESYDPDGNKWFAAKIDLFGFDPIKTTDEDISAQLTRIFESCVRLNSDFLSKWKNRPHRQQEKSRLRTQTALKPQDFRGGASPRN